VLASPDRNLSPADCGPYAGQIVRMLFERDPGAGAFSIRWAGAFSKKHCGSERPIAVRRGIPASSWLACFACGDCKQLPAGA